MIRAAAKDANVDLEDETDFGILGSMEARGQGRHPFGFHRPHRS